MTITLHEDLGRQPIHQELTATHLISEFHSDILLHIPEPSRQYTDTLYWIQFFISNSVMALDSMPVSVLIDRSLPPVSQFEVEKEQMSDGSIVTVKKLNVIDDVKVEILGDIAGRPNLNKSLTRQPLSRPRQYADIPIFIPPDKQPQRDITLWL